MFHSHPSKNKQTKKPSINSIFLPLESHSSPKDTYLCFYSDNYHLLFEYNPVTFLSKNNNRDSLRVHKCSSRIR